MSNRFDLLIFESIQEEKERRAREKKVRDKNLAEIEEKGHCEGWWGPCDIKKDVKWISSMTQCCWDIDKEPLVDPNRPLFLCPECAQGYIDCWQERWDEYYSGLL